MSGTAIAIIASAQSTAAAAAAAQAAHDAKVARCTVIESTFNQATATVELKQDYASCISFLYPQPSEQPPSFMTRASILAIVFVLVVATIAGVIRGWREDSDVMLACLVGIVYAMVAALAVGGVALAVWGVKVALA
ncbi:hypothetical protein KB681_gp39 [Burkholderia phage Mica]|uniref:Putative membrane protein n=1 Tax=Burkholderia phage Mica TaxID=2767579 RepID=A0A873WEL6_9CAUD|nr:hypothetical protein KB681_gp39 [Burkholderia phage Mica]QPB08673.1 putative membrane protein [Burkholderia phage Mica]